MNFEEIREFEHDYFVTENNATPYFGYEKCSIVSYVNSKNIKNLDFYKEYYGNYLCANHDQTQFYCNSISINCIIKEYCKYNPKDTNITKKLYIKCCHQVLDIFVYIAITLINAVKISDF
jgi:hypothetical protein